MSTWQDRAKIAVRDVLSVGNIARWGWLFVSGARWQREALLTDDAVERVARALYAEDVNESIDTPWPDYDSPKNVGRPLYEERARNALLAAIEGDE